MIPRMLDRHLTPVISVRPFRLPYSTSMRTLDDVARVFRIAAEYRTQFQSDVIIDLIGYRKFGHNELDQPLFTQPTMYNKIKSHPSCLDIYTSNLLSSSRVNNEEVDEIMS